MKGMASVAKWLRQWIVVPPLAGSSPVVRPIINLSTRFFQEDGFLIISRIFLNKDFKTSKN